MEEVYPSTPLHTVLEEQAEKLAAQEGLNKVPRILTKPDLVDPVIRLNP